jgi:heme O synthase-like polyprenyltransferase
MYIELGDIERTKNRPLARGDLNFRQAIVYLGTQLTVGLSVLLQLNWDRYVSSLFCSRCRLFTPIASYLVLRPCRWL